MVTTNGDRSPWVTDAPNPIYRPPNGRLAPSSGRRVLRSISRTPIAHLVNARSPPPARFHASFTQHIHALGRVIPWWPTDAQASAKASGLRSNCANCAQQVRRSIRTVGTQSDAYRQLVRTSGSQSPTREPSTFITTACLRTYPHPARDLF